MYNLDLTFDNGWKQQIFQPRNIENIHDFLSRYVTPFLSEK